MNNNRKRSFLKIKKIIKILRKIRMIKTIQLMDKYKDKIYKIKLYKINQNINIMRKKNFLKIKK